MQINIKIYDDQVKEGGEDPQVDQTANQKLIGKILYLNMTRPDISSVQTLSQFLQQPKKSHIEGALRIVRYIKKSSEQGLLLSSSSDNTISGYCDADWAVCPFTRRSVPGYVVKMRSSLISWKAKKQSTVSRSSTEAEYRSLTTATKELVWLLGLLEELNVEIKKPVKVFCDSKTTIQLAVNPVYHERTKHIEINCHFIRERLEQGLIENNYVPTQQQPADIFTKGLNKARHEFLLSKLGILNIFISPSLRGSIKT